MPNHCFSLLRYLLVEAVQTAVRYDEDLKRFYKRLAERRGRPKAKVAAARKLTHGDAAS
jgi:transposase